MEFYKVLFAPDLMFELKFKVFDNMWQGSFIAEETHTSLQLEVTRNEITEVLSLIHDDKAPGTDGFFGFLFKTLGRILR